jgi:hypothetical protein
MLLYFTGVSDGVKSEESTARPVKNHKTNEVLALRLQSAFEHGQNEQENKCSEILPGYIPTVPKIYHIFCLLCYRRWREINPGSKSNLKHFTCLRHFNHPYPNDKGAPNL